MRIRINRKDGSITFKAETITESVDLKNALLSGLKNGLTPYEVAKALDSDYEIVSVEEKP